MNSHTQPRLALLLAGVLLFPGGGTAADTLSPALPRILPSEDGTHFMAGKGGTGFVVWGVNYDRDDAGRLLESYWEKEWPTVEEDFQEMKELGANVVRIHLQTGAFMKDPETPDSGNLARLGKLVRLAESCGLYLDITGLGCYLKQEVPAWYAAMDETARWKVQARFWKAVAETCRQSPAVFCYNLMNEPIIAGGPQPEDWLPGEPLDGKHYVQRITTDAKGRSEPEIALQWVKKMTSAIRTGSDPQPMITVGVITWAQIFPGALPAFYAPEAAALLDFTSIHLYPRTGRLTEDLAAMKVHEIGKPLLIEEIFPLSATLGETEAFIAQSKTHVDGWISFYWGKTPAQYTADTSLAASLTGGWLKQFKKMGPEIKRFTPSLKP